MTSTHVAPAGQMAWLRTSVLPAGLVIGRDMQQQPVTVRLFRDEPTRVVVIGGWWLSWLVVFRTLAVGARVVVRTSAIGRWQGLAQAAQGGGDRLSVIVGEQPVEVPANQTSPVLLVDDLGQTGASQRAAQAPWQTRLTILPRLTRNGLAVTGEATMVIAQRLTAQEASGLAELLRLSAQTTSLLQVMHDDMIALVGGGADRYVWVNATSVEQRFFGPPHRAE